MLCTGGFDDVGRFAIDGAVVATGSFVGMLVPGAAVVAVAVGPLVGACGVEVDGCGV